MIYDQEKLAQDVHFEYDGPMKIFNEFYNLLSKYWLSDTIISDANFYPPFFYPTWLLTASANFCPRFCL